MRLGSINKPAGITSRGAHNPARIVASPSRTIHKPQPAAMREAVTSRFPSMMMTPGAAAPRYGVRVASVAEGGVSAQGSSSKAAQSYITTSVMGTTVEEFIADMADACASGADIVELRLDFLTDFDTERDLERIMKACTLPYIVTCRAKWEGGNYGGAEAERLATLKYAAMLGAPYVDVEYLAAPFFFASAGEVPISTKVILSSHDFKATPPADELRGKAKAMLAAGADIVKIATTANDITDAAVVLSLLLDPVALVLSPLLDRVAK
eukprot:gene1722-33130_t